MEIELEEIRDFIAQCPPFEQLPDDCLNRLPYKFRQGYLRRGEPFPANDSQAGLYLLRQGAVGIRDENDILLRQIAEGEYFNYQCDEAKKLKAHTLEDTLYLVLDCEQLSLLQQQHPAFRDAFQRSRIKRLQDAIKTLHQFSSREQKLFQQRISDYQLPKPCTIDSNVNIQQAAEHMSEQNSSCLLVMQQSKLKGILTDSDLRSRVLARSLPLTTSISEIMTPEPITIEDQTSAFEALMLMNRNAIQHLPVMRRGQLHGLLSNRELLHAEQHHDLYLVTQLRQATERDEMIALCKVLPELQLQLVNNGANSQQLGQMLAQISDTLTQTLLEMAIKQLGPAPVDWLWVSCGSQARREQTISSDQDHALILANDYQVAQHDDYFAALARYVSDGLHACGFVYCPGESMALNSHWRRSLEGWQQNFRNWINKPEPQSLRYAVNFFDMRPIAGKTELYQQLQQTLLPQVKSNEIFLSHLAALAGKQRPPLGFFRHFVLIDEGEHLRQLDLKLGGLTPVVEMARVFGLAAGSKAQNTCQRLQDAVVDKRLSQERVDSLLEAYELIATLRLRHQVAQVQAGENVDNYLDPAKLSTLERNHLRDAFRIIKDMQEYMAHHYHSGMFF